MSSWQLNKWSNTSGVLWHYLSTLSGVIKGVILPDGLAEELSPFNPSSPAYKGAPEPPKPGRRHLVIDVRGDAVITGSKKFSNCFGSGISEILVDLFPLVG